MLETPVFSWLRTLDLLPLAVIGTESAANDILESKGIRRLLLLLLLNAGRLALLNRILPPFNRSASGDASSSDLSLTLDIVCGTFNEYKNLLMKSNITIIIIIVVVVIVFIIIVFIIIIIIIIKSIMIIRFGLHAVRS